MYEKMYVSPRPTPTISFKDNWMKELDSEVARQPEGEVGRQAKPKTQLSRTGRPVGGQESTQEIEKDILFGHEDIKHSTRKRETRGWIEIHPKLRVDAKKIEEEDQTRTVRPVGRQSTKVEELDIDFRVPGLSLAVVKEAEHIRVQELAQRIESHPHRAALQADLQQNNVYNPFSKNSKAMIRELGNVELFEWCETTPKIQCSHCLLYWNQGIVYCTCGQCLIFSESRRNLNKLRLDALSIPHYVIKKGRFHGARHGKTEEQKEYHFAWNAWKRCCKKIDSQGEHFTGINDRFLRDQVYRESQLLIGWTEQKCIEMDELAKQNYTYHLSLQSNSENTKETIVSHLEQVRQKWAYETSTRFSSCCLSQKPSPPRVR